MEPLPEGAAALRSKDVAMAGPEILGGSSRIALIAECAQHARPASCPARSPAPRAPSALQDRRHAHSARGAHGDEAPLGLVLIENLCERRHDARAGRGERMTQGEAPTLDVELRAVDGPEHPRQAELLAAKAGIVPGLESAQHLSREGFVNLVEVEI